MKYAFINGIILNGDENMELISNKTILVDNGTITNICDSAQPNFGYLEVDLKGRYIMPGLINMHVHFHSAKASSGILSGMKEELSRITNDEAYKKQTVDYCLNQAQVLLKSGVTTVRTVGGFADVDVILRDKIQARKADGPRILATSMAISPPGGHMAGVISYVAKSNEEARKYVRTIAESRPDIIKLMVTGGVFDASAKGEPGVLRMPLECIRAACQEAHALGFTVAAHVEGTAGLRAALKGGVDTIEHGAGTDNDIIRLYKENGSSLVATFSPLIPFALFDLSVSHTTELAKYNGQIVLNGVIDNAVKGIEAGIPVGLGTDTGCPFVTYYDMWRELVYFQKFCNVSNRFALYTATKRNAEIAGLSTITGTIAPGKSADMIVTERNPLEDLSALRNISMVVMAGKVIENLKIEKFLDYERELDKFI